MPFLELPIQSCIINLCVFFLVSLEKETPLNEKMTAMIKVIMDDSLKTWIAGQRRDTNHSNVDWSAVNIWYRNWSDMQPLTNSCLHSTPSLLVSIFSNISSVRVCGVSSSSWPVLHTML